MQGFQNSTIERPVGVSELGRGQCPLLIRHAFRWGDRRCDGRRDSEPKQCSVEQLKHISYGVDGEGGVAENWIMGGDASFIVVRALAFE